MMLPRLLRSVAAALVLLALVIGLPLLLYRVAGSPLPDRLPNGEEILDTLTRRDDGTLLVWVMEAVAWGAWAWFTFTVVAETIGRVTGAGFGWLPNVFGMRHLAVYLISSATVAVSAHSAMAATPPPTSVVATAPLRPAAVPNQMMYKVQQGDTLWGIADDQLGNGRRWPQIWKANAHKPQSDGRIFRDPDLIYPGWRLRILLPPNPKPPAQVTPTPARSAPPTAPPPAASTTDEAQSAVIIRLPSGSMVTLAYVAGITTALAAKRLLQRRSAPEEIAPAVRQARQAHIGAHHERSQSVPSDRDLVRHRHETLDVPGQITIAVDAHGQPIHLNLGGLELGLTGPGADDVARYLINDLVQQAHNFRTQVIVTSAVASQLWSASAPAVPGLTIANGECFEEIVFGRQRMLMERDVDSIDKLRELDPGESLPAVILVAESEPTAPSDATGTGVVILGRCATGTNLHINDRHRVADASGPLTALMTGAELCHLQRAESAQHLDVLAPPETEQRDDLPDEDVWNGPALIRLSILGSPLVQVRGKPRPLDLSWLQLNTLAYLALNPEGATNAELTTALWPDEVGKAIHNTLRHLREALVNATEYSNPDPKTAPFISASTTKRTAIYRLDQRLVSIDLHEYQTALNEARSARSDDARMQALERAATFCRGELMKGVDAEWIDEHRYIVTRSQADTLTRLADLHTSQDPERSVDLLERVRTLEPGTEETYLQIIQLQVSMGRRQEARRTVELLRHNLDELGARPSRHAEQVIDRLLPAARRS